MRLAARVGLVLALFLVTFIAPAALVTQVPDTRHDVHFDADPAMLAVAGILVALAYTAFLWAWRALRLR